MKIGKKLKELRTQNGLTLEELANRSELTKGSLSQLERDLTSPNISALENILEALGTNLADFFQSSKEEQIVFHTQDFFVNEQDDLVTEYIIPNAQKNQMEPLLLTLKPGAKSQEVKEGEQDFSCLKNLYSRADVFGVDLYEVGLGEQIEGMVKELYAGNGAVRKTLHKYVVAR